MAFSKLLLPLICMLIPRIRYIQGRPADFVCNDRARRDMINVKNLEDAMNNCDGPDVLPSTIQLPCVRIQRATWERKSLLQQHAEVAGGLRLLCGGLGALRGHTSLTECQKSVLSRMDHHLRNHLLIVNQLKIQQESPGVTTPRPATGPPAECPSQPSRSFREVLQQYQALLRGKLDRLATALQNITCLHW